MTRDATRGWLIRIIAMILCLSSPSVSAQTPTPNAPNNATDEPEAQSVALLLMIDQSRSIWGEDEVRFEEGLRERADPDGSLRLAVLEYLLDVLFSFQLRQTQLNVPLDVHVAALNFTGLAEIAQSWTALSDPTQTSNQRQNLIDAINIPQGSALRGSRYDETAQTDYINAFRTAFDLLETVPNQGPQTLNILVLVSDGVPCAPERAEWDSQCFFGNDDFGGPDREEHLETVEDLLRRNFTGPNELFTFVHIGGDNSQGWRKSAADWENEIASPETIFYLNTPADVNARLQPLQNVLLQRLNLMAGNPINAGSTNQPINLSVLPYRQSLQLTLVKTDPERGWTLRRPDDTLVQRSDDDVRRVIGPDSFIETWIIHHPSPGLWRATLNDPNAQLYMETEPARFTFHANDEGQMYQHERFVLRVQDDANNPLPLYDNARYRLQAEIVLIEPGGRSVAFPLSADGPGRFVAHYLPLNDGTHTLRVQGEAGTSNLTMSLPTLPTRELDVKPTQIRIEGLDDDPRIIEGARHRYRVRLLDENGQALDLPITRFEVALLQPEQDQCANVNATTAENASAAPGEPLIETQYRLIAEQRLACVTLAIQGPNGESVLILDNTPRARLNVLPADEVALALRRPYPIRAGQEEERYRIMDPATRLGCVFGLLPCFKMPEMTLEVQIVPAQQSANAEPLLIADDLTDEEREDYIILELFDQNETNLVEQMQLDLTPRPDNPSIWMVQLPQLPHGDYRLRLTTREEDTIGDSSRRFTSEGQSLQTTLVVAPNPIYEGFRLAGGGGALALMVLVMWRAVLQPSLRRQGAATGTIAIYRKAYTDAEPNPDGSTSQPSEKIEQLPGCQYDLDPYRANQIDIPLTQLPTYNPPIIGLRIISNRRLKADNQIRVEVRTRYNGPPAADNLRYGRGLLIYNDVYQREYYVFYGEPSSDRQPPPA